MSLSRLRENGGACVDKEERRVAQGTTTTWYKGTTPKVDFKVKKDRMGTVVRNKCRLVAQGFFQVFGEDYNQTYSPVAKFTSIRTLLALSAQLELTVR